MRPRNPLAWLPLLSVLALVACGTTPPLIIDAPRAVIPDSLLTCSPQPEPPADSGTDTDLATWIVDMGEAGQDCRDKLAAMRKVVAP